MRLKLFSKNLTILFCTLFLVGCADNIKVSKKEAVDAFVDRSEKLAQDFKDPIETKAYPKTLIQFTYGPDSLKNNNFLEYLVLSKANLSSDVLKQIEEEENEYQYKLNERKTYLNIYKKQLENYQKESSVYKRLAQETNVSFTDTRALKIIQELVSQAGLNFQKSIEENPKEPFNENIKTSIQTSGKLIDVLEEVASKYKLHLSLTRDFKTIVVSNKPAPTNLKIDKNLTQDVNLAERDFKKIQSALSELSDDHKKSSIGDGKYYADKLETKFAQNFIEKLMYQINEDQIFESKIREASELRKALIGFSDSKNSENIQPKTTAIFKENLKNGEEKVIQKFNIFNDSPENMLTLLQSYSIFNCGKDVKPLTPGSNNKNTPQSLMPGQIQTVPQIQNSNNTTLQNQNNKTDQGNVQQSNTQQNTPQQNLGQFKASDDGLNYLSDKKENDDSNSLYIANTSGCVIFNKDSTGIVASGSIVDMQLVDHFISDQDKPVKQAMIEVYIVEVSTGWQRQIQSKINQGNNKFATGVVGNLTNGGGLSMSAVLGNKVNIASFISLLEANSLGRSISNPLILVKDGKTGVVNKVREIKQILTNPATSGGNTLIPATQQVNTVDAPLNLEITANINKHNDNIQLKFVFKETTFDDDTNFVSPSTKNEINSELIAQPGEVIVMAGLLKEKNNKSYTGLPGLSSLGLNSLYGSFVSLLGGSQTQTNSGSELLVFINPTVITNKNIGKTLNRANY